MEYSKSMKGKKLDSKQAEADHPEKRKFSFVVSRFSGDTVHLVHGALL